MVRFEEDVSRGGVVCEEYFVSVSLWWGWIVCCCFCCLLLCWVCAANDGRLRDCTMCDGVGVLGV